jgi:hypothetical protein
VAETNLYLGDVMDNRMLCSISDDPYADYSDYIEEDGVYKPYQEEPCEPEDDPRLGL